jgi:aspartyl-tRNA(Asn)/glutamyl-tRNA(Gln) amidotransferase subunit C
MRLSREEVEHVAELAKLGLSDEEVESFRAQLSDILDNVEILAELDTTNVQPMAHVTGVENVTREDVVTACLPRSSVLANAPDQEDGYLRVPVVLEG